jgi:hypothetical protein
MVAKPDTQDLRWYKKLEGKNFKIYKVICFEVFTFTKLELKPLTTYNPLKQDAFTYSQ